MWFQALNTVWMRSALFWDFTQRGEILTAVLVKNKVIWDVLLCQPVITVIFRVNIARWRQYVLPKRPLPFTSRQGVIFLNSGVRTSCLTEQKTVPGRVTMYDASLWRSLPHSRESHTGLIFQSVHYGILKLWLTPISAQFCSLCISVTCRS